jgi:hypothetical protein
VIVAAETEVAEQIAQRKLEVLLGARRERDAAEHCAEPRRSSLTYQWALCNAWRP